MLPDSPELIADAGRWLPDPAARRRLQRLKDERLRVEIRAAIDSLHPELSHSTKAQEAGGKVWTMEQAA